MAQSGLSIGPFRGLCPYLEQDADIFVGREAERRLLLERVMEPDLAAVLVMGETGAGKTSLIRAGLLPRLPAADWTALYLECGPDWSRDLAGALSRILQRPVDLDQPLADPLGEAVSGSKRFLLVLDHLEQLLWLDPQQGQQLEGVIQRVQGEGGKLVLAVDRGNIHALERLTQVGRIAESQRVHLGRMERDAAGKVMEQTVLAGGGYMEAGLPELMADELCARGPVLPAALQVVGHAAVLSGATRVRRFSRAGGSLALTALYVEHLVARCGGWRARRVLAVLTERANPREARAVADIAASCGLSQQVTATTLYALREQGLVARRDEPDAIKPDPHYTVIHPYLLQSIRDTVAPVLRGRAQARLSLRRRVHERGVLRPDELVRVWRYLGSSISAPEQEQVRRGVRVWAGVGAGLLALPLLLALTIYLVLASSTFVDSVESKQGERRVVVRSGRPSLSFAFNMASRPFGEVLVDTGLVSRSLPAPLRQAVADGAIVGGSVDANSKGSTYWLRAILPGLSPVRRGALQILAGEVQAGSQLLQQSAANPAQRARAARALALLSGDSPATRAALLACVKDGRPEVRRMAVEEAKRLSAQGAEAVLAPAVRDADNQIRLAALKALRELPSKQVLNLLAVGLRDSDPRVQQEAVAQLKKAASKLPVLVFEIVRKALAGRTDARAGTLEASLEQLLRQAQLAAPKAVAAHLMRLVEQSSDGPTKIAALGRLRDLTDSVNAARALTVVGRLVNSEDPKVKAAAIPLQARFGNPDEIEAELYRLAYTVGGSRRHAALMRRAAAAGLGLLRDRPDDKRLKLLRHLLSDPSSAVRAAAMESLVKLGKLGLGEVVRGIKNGPRDVALVALRTVCKDARPDRRVATTVLATAWRIERADVRGEALGCARNMAATNPRLSLWLADNARLDKTPEVRRAAAEAVALAVARYGKRLLTLTRFYLRQDDPTIVVAVLQAMARTAPGKDTKGKRSTGWLFREVVRLTGHASPSVRAATAPLLVATAPNAAAASSALVRLLQDDKASVVRAATAAAGKLPPGPAVRRLDKPLARVVGAARSKDAVAALRLAQTLGLERPIRRAAVHPEAEVRAAAVAGLAQGTRDKQALALLESALRDPEQRIRLAALDAIASQSKRLGQPAVTLLVRSTRAQAPAERWAAFAALGQVRGEAAVSAAVEVLQREARHRSEERRRLAMRSLGGLAPRSRQAVRVLMAGALDPAVDVRTEAQAVLAKHMGRHSPPAEIVDLLLASERDAVQRQLACAAMAWYGRFHGPKKADEALAERITPASPMVLRMAANLARALARREDRPEQVVSWIFGV